MVFQAEDRAKVKKQQTELAIQLALQGRWEAAADLNRSIIELFPADVDAYNRLGKALTELGRYGDARDAYSKALEIDPLNSIARKNLARLATLGEQDTPRQAGQKLSPDMFIEEMGKTGITTLLRPNMEVAARMTAGDRVDLQPVEGSLVINSLQGDYIGEIEPRLAQRLIKLIDGGNQYVAAVTAINDTTAKVFIRETFQHPTQLGKLSFPPTVTESFRPFTKERLLRQDAADAAYYEDVEEAEEWEAGERDEAALSIYRLKGRAALPTEDEEPGEPVEGQHEETEEVEEEE